MATFSSSFSSCTTSGTSPPSSFGSTTRITAKEALQETFFDILVGLLAGRGAKLRIERKRVLEHFQSLPDAIQEPCISSTPSKPLPPQASAPTLLPTPAAFQIPYNALFHTAPFQTQCPPITRNGRPVLDLAAPIFTPIRHQSPPTARDAQPVLDLTAQISNLDIKQELKPAKKLSHPNRGFFDFPYRGSESPPTQVLRSGTVPNLATDEIKNVSFDEQLARGKAINEVVVKSSIKGKAEAVRLTEAINAAEGPYPVRRHQVMEYYQAIKAGLHPIPGQCKEYYHMEIFEARRKNKFPPRRAVVWESYVPERELAWTLGEERVWNVERPERRVWKKRPKPVHRATEHPTTAAKAGPAQEANRANVVRPELARARRRTRYTLSGTRIA